MLDLQYICDNQAAVEANCRNRGVTVDIPRIVELRKRRGELISGGDEMRRQQKETSEQIPKAAAADKPAIIARGKQLKEQIASGEKELEALECELRELMLQVPNLTHPDAPVAGDETGSVEISRFGEARPFDFKALDHVELMEKHGLLDLEAGTRVAGHGFYFLKNEAVLLEMALVQYALGKLRDAGFTLFSTPDLAKAEVLQGTGYNPRGESTQIYSITGTDLSLVATAEITLGGSLMGEILDIGQLPLKYCGLSHCFRTEAGAHGRATRGIYRVHQFTKVEIFGFTAPDLEASDAFHREILKIEEEIFQGLGIPYRVIDTASGDLGGPAYRKFDLEAWMPGRGEAGEFGEVTSASNCTDYQARRLGIRCRVPGKKGTEFVHTLNGTAIACTRAMIALLENNQQADGSIVIPEPLRKWVGQDKIG